MFLGGQACFVLSSRAITPLAPSRATKCSKKILPQRFHVVVWGLTSFCHNWLDYFGFSVSVPRGPLFLNAGEPGPLREQRRGCQWGAVNRREENTRLLSRGLGDKGVWSHPSEGQSPLGDGLKVTESWEGETLNLLDDILFVHSSNFFTDLLFDYGSIPSSLFTVFQLNTRKIWKCTHIYSSGFQSAVTLPLPQQLAMSGDVSGAEGLSHWHLVGRGQEHCSTSYKAWDGPSNKKRSGPKYQRCRDWETLVKSSHDAYLHGRKKQEEERKKNEAVCNRNLYIPASVR